MVQGLTEPLPVSSSAHLLLMRWALRWDDEGAETARALDVALHVGTAAGTAVVLRPEVRRLLAGLRAGDARAWAVALSPVPAAVVGGPLAPLVHRRLATVRTTALLLTAAGVAAAAAEGRADRVSADHAGLGRAGPGRDEPTVADVAVMALAQVAALVPGVSRTTAATVAARGRGLSPAAARRTTVLLSLPVVAAAGVRHSTGIRQVGRAGAVGGAAAGVTTAAALHHVLAGRSPDLRAAAHYRAGVTVAVGLLALARRRRRAAPRPRR